MKCFFLWFRFDLQALVIWLLASIPLAACGLDGCRHHGVLSGRNRAQGHTDEISLALCDKDGFVSGWYRFQGDAGKMMPDQCVPMWRCGTHAPGWLNGSHPTFTEGPVQRQVCFHWENSCCYKSTNIGVRNCGSFFVYELQPTPMCALRYCGNAEESQAPSAHGTLGCPQEIVDGVAWSRTIPGATDIKPCPDAQGSATRKCLAKNGSPVWEDAVFVNCTSLEFILLAKEAAALTGSGPPTNTSAMKILQRLAQITKPMKNVSSRPGEIYGGDVQIAVDMLGTLQRYNSETSGNDSLSNRTGQETFVLAASNLVDTANVKSWIQLDKESRNTSTVLVNVLDNFGMKVAEELDRNSTSVVYEHNVVMRVDKVDRADHGVKAHGLAFTHQKSTIVLPPDAFSRSTSSHVSSFVYLTLDKILFLKTQPGSDSLASRTALVSSTVRPSPPSHLRAPVRIDLEKREKTIDQSNASCVFWRANQPMVWQDTSCRLVPSESDDVISCECDHLTLFAALVDPHGVKLQPKQKEELEIISLVGCSISIVAVLVTAGVTFFFRKFLDESRTAVLLNICAAIAMMCLLAIGERWARDHEVACVVVAALLHFSLLAVFSWMLCEGILLYIKMVRVFGKEDQQAIKYFHLFGWGFPAIIVGITLGATKTSGYGANECCWLSTESGLIWAMVAPALIVILANSAAFVLVHREMSRVVTHQEDLAHKISSRLRASGVILPLLGLTWAFGILSFNSDTLVFKYIFTLLNSLQGLMIFVFNCLLSKQLRDAFSTWRRRKRSWSLDRQEKQRLSEYTVNT